MFCIFSSGKVPCVFPQTIFKKWGRDLCVAFITAVTGCSLGQAVGKSPVWEDRILAGCDLVGSVLKLEFFKLGVASNL